MFKLLIDIFNNIYRGVTVAQFDIEEILYDAHALGIRKEVIECAGNIMQLNKYYDISVAYNIAYNIVVAKHRLTGNIGQT